MKYEVQITWEDYKAAHRLHARAGPIGRGIEFILMAGVLLIVLLGVDFRIGPKTERSLWLLGGLLAFGAIWFFLVVPYRWRRAYQQQTVFHAPMTYEFTDETWISTSQYSSVSFPWAMFHKWREGEHSFIIYESDNLFRIIPKRIFGSAEEIEQFRAILTKGIGKTV